MKSFVLFFSCLFFGISAMAASGGELFSGCKGCHGADGSKNALGVSNPLKGQSKEDIIKKLNGYKNESYGGAKKNIMKGQASRLSDTDIESLAEYISKF